MMARTYKCAPVSAVGPASDELLHDFTGFDGFEEASRAALEFLQGRVDFALWMITRTEGDDWIVLNALDESYGIGPGDVFRWSDSFCSRMVRGEGPMIAPDSTLVSAYVDAPVGQQLDISAYVGTPVCAPDGSLFGTLCAVDPNPRGAEIERELPLVRLISKMLATVLSTELRLHDQRRRAEREEMAANQDPLTGVGTRRFWETVLAAEEERCRILGTRAAVVMIDFDGLKEINDVEGHHAGDAVLAAGARAIGAATRREDVVARIGGDEFGVLAVDCSEADIAKLAERIRKSLATAGVSCSVGYSMREPRLTIGDAWRKADEQMYDEKRQRTQAA